MPPKRPLSPISLPPSKRRFITSWLGATDCPQTSIEEITKVLPPVTSVEEDSDEETVFNMSRAISGVPSTTSATGSTEIAWVQALEHCRIFPAELSEVPTNLDEIKSLFAAVRSTPEPSLEAYQSLEADIYTAASEEQVREVFSEHIKKPWKTHKTVELTPNKLWTNFVPLPSSGTTAIKKPKPDFTCCIRKTAFPSWYEDHRIIASGSHTKVTKYHDEVAPGLMWPLISIELKGEQGTMADAIRQNAHSGAVMVANLLELKKRAGLEIPYGHADVFTISMDKVAVGISAHWAVLNDRGDTKFLHKTVHRWLVGFASLATFIEAQRAVRNTIETHLKAMLSVIISDLERVRERDLQAQAEREASSTPVAGEYTTPRTARNAPDLRLR